MLPKILRAPYPGLVSSQTDPQSASRNSSFPRPLVSRRLVLLNADITRHFYHRLVLLRPRVGLAGGDMERFTGLPLARLDAAKNCGA